MKRLLCGLAAAILALGCFGCAAAEETAMDRFLNDWTGLLYMHEDRLSQENHALDTVVRFTQSGDWDDLVRAKATTAYTCKLIEHYSQTPAGQTATAADYELLIGQGMDIGDVSAEVRLYNSETLATLQSSELPLWRGYLLASLMELAYLRDTLEELETWALASIRCNELDMRYMYLINNYISLELPKEDADTLAKLTHEHMPHIMSKYDKPFPSVNDVLNEMNNVIGLYEEAVIALENAVLLAQVNTDTIDFGSCTQLLNCPELVPYPSFLDSEQADILYAWRDEQGKLTPVSRLMDIDALPTYMSLTAHGAGEEAYRSYIVCLNELGYHVTDMTQSAAQYQFDNGAVMSVWVDESDVCICVDGGQLCLAPQWYITAMRGGQDAPENP